MSTTFHQNISVLQIVVEVAVHSIISLSR